MSFPPEFELQGELDEAHVEVPAVAFHVFHALGFNQIHALGFNQIK